MIDEMQVENSLTIDMVKAHVLEIFLGDCMVSLYYMSTKVAFKLPARSEGGIKHKGDLQDLQI